MTARTATNAVRLTALEGRMDRIEGLLTTLVAQTRPTTPQTAAEKRAQAKSAATRRRNETTAILAAHNATCPPATQPVEALTFTGSCHDCGKTGLLANVLCGKCKRARDAKGVAVPSKPTVTERRVPAAQIPTGKAKGNTNGHCDAPSCGKFLNNLGTCKVHG